MACHGKGFEKTFEKATILTQKLHINSRDTVFYYLNSKDSSWSEWAAYTDWISPKFCRFQNS